MTPTETDQLLTDLKALEALFAPGPHTWTQGTLARDSHGDEIDTDEPAATCFCLFGGIRKVARNTKMKKLAAVIRRAANYDSIFEWNDAGNRTYEDVVAVIRKAITNVEGEL